MMKWLIRSNLSKFLITLLISWTFICSVQAQESVEKESATQHDQPPLIQKDAFRYDGFISAKAVSKSIQYDNETAQDLDLYTKMRLSLFMGAGNDYEFHLFTSARSDMDGNQDQSIFYPSENIGDTQKSQLTQVFEAHFDLNHLGNISQIRLGRQSGTREKWIYFDGISLDLEMGRSLDFTFYGGNAVHFFEKNTASDPLSGFGADYKFLPSTTLVFDYMLLKDYWQNRTEEITFEDKLVSFKINQKFSRQTKALVKYRWINGESRDVKFRAISQEIPLDLEVNFNYFRQFQSQNRFSTDTSVFYEIIGETKPHQSFDLKIRKLLGENNAFDIGHYQRQLLDTKDESVFNRNFSRTFGVFECYRFFSEKLTLALTGEKWSSMTYEGNTGGFEVEYNFTKESRSPVINFGSYYSVFKYDYYEQYGERTGVQTLFANANLPVGENYKVKGSLEVENTTEKYQILTLGVRRDF